MQAVSTSGIDASLRDPERIWSFTMRRFATLILIVLFAGCAKSPERAALDKANVFLDEGHVQAAWDTVEYYLHQHPDSAPLLRMRVVVLLREQQLDQAALAMKQIPAGRSIVPEILRHHDRVVRESAAKLISDQPSANDFHELVHALDDSDFWVRGYCAHALGRLGNPAALKPLFRLLTDDNWFVRAEAATAIGKLGDVRAVGWLVQLLADTDGNVRYSVARALYELATAPPARPLLQRALALAAPAQQFDIAVALARLHDPAALKPLADAVQNKEPEIRRLAAHSLGECGLMEGTNALSVLLRDTDPTVREQAQMAIDQITNGEKK
jgi:HEAT repeat protein